MFIWQMEQHLDTCNFPGLGNKVKSEEFWSLYYLLTHQLLIGHLCSKSGISEHFL